MIIISENAADVVKYAAETLQKYIGEITGSKPEISSDANFKGRKIFIGDTEKSGVTAENLPDGSYILKEKDGSLYITGSGQRGNIYGVFGFLERYCSCRRYTSDVVVIPKAGSLSVPKDLFYIYKPYFEFTDTDWSSPHDSEYSLANGLNSGVYRTLTPEQGGTVNYISNMCHTLTTQFCSADRYFAAHPEYFALHEGKRDPGQLCLTNPDVLKIVTDEVLALIKEKYDPKQPLQIISLTQNDNNHFCTCDKCRELDDRNGSHAGTMISFANAVAEKVKEAGCGSIAIDTFAYQYTRQAPTAVIPADNVIVRLCSIECCFSHPLNCSICQQNKKFMKDLKDWKKICSRIYVWDYATNYNETVNIFPNFQVLQSNMQTLYENNVKGVYVEGNYYIDRCDAEFGELRAYLISKLLQNPYMDFDDEMNGFLKAFYGDGWENIRRFIDFTCERIKLCHMGEGQPSEYTFPTLSNAELMYCDKLWRDAKKAARDEVYIKRIERSELSWRHWKCAHMRGEFSRLLPCCKWMEEQEKLYFDFVAFGVQTLGEGSGSRLTKSKTLRLLAPSQYWRECYEKDFYCKIESSAVRFYTLMKNIRRLLSGLTAFKI